MKLSEANNAFARYLRSKGRSAGTERSYGYLLDRWGRWLEGRAQEWTEVQLEDIEEFLEEYRDTHSATSTALLGTCLRSFYKWARRRKLVPESPAADLEPIQRDNPPPRAVPDWQIRQRLQKLDNPPAGLPDEELRLWARNRLIVRMFLYTGLRLAELAELTWEDVDFDARTIRVRNGKGKSNRVVPINMQLRDDLRAWLRGPASGPLFHSFRGMSKRKVPRKNSQLSDEGISEMFRAFVEAELGFKITAHMLRHTCATKLRQRGADLRTIQRLLGHSNPRTTAIYTAVYDDDLHGAADKLAGEW